MFLPTKTISKSYNPISNQLVTTQNKNLSGYSTYSASASLQTVLYGMQNLAKTPEFRRLDIWLPLVLVLIIRQILGKVALDIIKIIITREGFYLIFYF
jgi:hypothetical protein